jgi:hypothetical protein
MGVELASAPVAFPSNGWRVRRRSLSHSTPPAALRGLVQAWRGLGAATASPATLADLLMVLKGTLNPAALDTARAGLPCGPVDLRAAICYPAAVRALLTSLAEYETAALRLLRQRGVNVKGWSVAGPELVKSAGPEHPRLLAAGLLPWLGAAVEVPAWAGTWLELMWGADADREGLLASIIQQGQPAWLPIVAAQPADRHSAWLRLLVETGAAQVPPPPRLERLFKTLHHLSDPKTWLDRARWALTGLTAGATPTYLAAALRWHLRHGSALPEVSGSEVKPDLRLLHLLLRRAPSRLKDYPDQLWIFLSADAAAAPAARQILAGASRQPLWQTDLLQQLSETEPTGSASGWTRRLFIRLLPTLIALPARMLSANRSDCQSLVGECIVRADRYYPGMEDDITYWLERIARGPFTLPWRALQFLSYAMGKLDKPGRLSLRSWKNDTLKTFAKRAEHYSFSYLIYGSLNAEVIPQTFLSAALTLHPKPMLEMLMALGALSAASIRRVWQAMAQHPLCECRPGLMRPGDAIVLLDHLAEGQDGIPALSDSVRRVIASGPAGAGPRWRDAMEQLTARWWRLAVGVFGVLVEWETARGYPGVRDEGVDFHTLRMARCNHTDGGNAQAYRRILRASSAGHASRDWALALPLNTDWLRKHPEARHPAWQEGQSVMVTVEKIGQVTLSLEDDLQEILRMGTRFHTCLSVGAINSHSPAAVALDANKRVLQARDAAGKVIARQLLAISEDRFLVCFEVYTLRQRTALRSVFATCNYMLARALRLPVWQSGEDYDIAKIVCREWYDDGAWMLWKEHVELVS